MCWMNLALCSDGVQYELELEVILPMNLRQIHVLELAFLFRSVFRISSARGNYCLPSRLYYEKPTYRYRKRCPQAIGISCSRTCIRAEIWGCPFVVPIHTCSGERALRATAGRTVYVNHQLIAVATWDSHHR